MTIKGTLETFNLCELLQMLAFNRKVGTLVLASESGTRTIYLDQGNATFAQLDPAVNEAILRLAKRHKAGSDDHLARAVQRHEDRRVHLAQVLVDLNLINSETLNAWLREATTDLLFEAQLTSVSGFEFVENTCVLPNGEEGRPITPAQPVDGLLLDLARQQDQWNAVADVVPSAREVFEGTGIAVDLTEREDIDHDLADDMVPLIDGRRSLEDLAAETHGTIYAIIQIAAVLFEGGGIRAVPTADLIARAEDMLARGEAAASLPMLRRCIERGDAPVDVRLRLADALEASGDSTAAASELDTFAALSDENNAAPVFEALVRALELREGELATAMRVCDFYLRRRPWLREYSTQATHALRDVIRGASAARRPLDAAHRLAGFIQAGDSPSEDLLLLADLYAAGGAPSEAASALVRRSEDLLASDRHSQAQDLLRRALELDPRHADARRRIDDMAGVKRRRLHKTRMSLLAILLIAVIGGAGAAWWFYRENAVTTVGGARVAAETALESAEREARKLIDAFKAHVAGIAAAEKEDKTLSDRAEKLRRDVRAAMSKCQRALSTYGSEIESYSASGDQERNRTVLRALEQRRHYMNTQAAAVVVDLKKRAHRALEAGSKLNREGQFIEARKLLRTARNLALDDDGTNDAETYADAVQLLANIDGYFDIFEGFDKRMTAAREEGDYEAAFQIGMEAVGELLDSDLTRSLRFPLQVETEPEGAQVWIGGEDTEMRTPCTVTYSPFIALPRLAVRMPGHTGEQVALPSYKKMVSRPEFLKAMKPRFRFALKEGPKFTLDDPAGAFTALWNAGAVPVVVGAKGYSVNAIDPKTGKLHPGRPMGQEHPPIRMGGALSVNTRWHVRGQLTLTVQPPSGEAWTQRTIGRIQQRPLLVAGLVVVMDEIGTLTAYDAATGVERWVHEFGEGPSQPPYPSRIGILIATVNGSAFKVDPATGKPERLVPSVKGRVFALPRAEGALVIGGGKDGLRQIDAKGTAEVLGDATPALDRFPVVADEVVAWIEADGVRVLSEKSAKATHIEGLGTDVVFLGLGPDRLVAAGADGYLRGVRFSDPSLSAWKSPLGGVAEQQPLVLGTTAYVLIAGRLVAVEI